MHCNQIIICGKIIGLGVLRYTPAGVAVIEFTLSHVSRQNEAGVARHIMCEISIIALGQLAMKVAELAINSKVKLTGFLDRRSWRNQQLVLHANDVILL